MQAILYPVGSIFAKLLLVTIIIISIGHMYYCNTALKLPVFFKGLNVMLFLYMIYSIYRFIDPRSFPFESTRALKNILISSLPIYSYYYYAVRGKFDEDMIRLFSIVFLIMVFAQYSYEAQQAMFLFDREEVTNNKGYKFLALLPFVCFFYKKPVFQYILMAFLLIMILMAMKRGAILAGVLCTLLLLYKQIGARKTSSKKTLLFLLIPALMFVLYYYIDRLYATSDYFVARYEQTMSGDASGRENMYPMILDYFLNQTNVFSFLFGEGIDSTYYIFHFFAHNDWLTYAVEFGLMGLVCYIYYWSTFYKTIRSKNKKDVIYIALLVILISDFLRSAFSFSLFDRDIYESCVLGFCLAMRSYNTVSNVDHIKQ